VFADHLEKLYWRRFCCRRHCMRHTSVYCGLTISGVGYGWLFKIKNASPSFGIHAFNKSSLGLPFPMLAVHMSTLIMRHFPWWPITSSCKRVTWKYPSRWNLSLKNQQTPDKDVVLISLTLWCYK
jgi:hypothetical protein